MGGGKRLGVVKERGRVRERNLKKKGGRTVGVMGGKDSGDW